MQQLEGKGVVLDDGERGVIVEELATGVGVHWPGAKSASGVRSFIDYGELAGMRIVGPDECLGLATKL